MSLVKEAAILFIFFVCLPVSSNAELPKASEQEVIIFAKTRLQETTERYLEKTVECDQRMKTAPIPQLDLSNFEGFTLEKTTIAFALHYIAYRNYDLCREPERSDYALALVNLRDIENYYGHTEKTVPDDEFGRKLFAPGDQIDDARYHKLPQAARKYLENAIGTQLFPIIETAVHYQLAPPLD